MNNLYLKKLNIKTLTELRLIPGAIKKPAQLALRGL